MRAIGVFSGRRQARIFPSAPAGSALARDRMMRGFSLLELLIALTVSSIAVLLAQPVIATGMLNLQRSTTINGMIRSLHFARRTAAEKGRDTTVCSSPDGWRCGAAEDWDAGWIVHDGPNGFEGARAAAGFDPLPIARPGRFVHSLEPHPVRVPAVPRALHQRHPDCLRPARKQRGARNRRQQYRQAAACRYRQRWRPAFLPARLSRQAASVWSNACSRWRYSAWACSGPVRSLPSG